MADATRADSVPFVRSMPKQLSLAAMKVMLAFLKRQTHGAGLCRRGAARHGAGSRPVTSMISRRSDWRAHRNESAPRLPPATSTERHLAPESARHLSGSRRCGEIAVSSSAPGGPWGVGDAREGWVVLRKGPWTRDIRGTHSTKKSQHPDLAPSALCRVTLFFRRTACTSPETVSRCVRHEEGVCRVSGASNEHSKRLDRS